MGQEALVMGRLTASHLVTHIKSKRSGPNSCGGLDLPYEHLSMSKGHYIKWQIQTSKTGKFYIFVS